MRKAIADFESEKFPLRIKIIEDRTTGYAAVSEIIEKWYQLNGYGEEMSFVVTIEIDDYVETVFVTRTESGDYEWDCDWWEGAIDFKLLGFCPIINAYLEIRGYPEIEDMPSADVIEVKHGEWERIESDTSVDFRCSVCHRYRFHNGEMLRKYKFCPNCGAKMLPKLWL